MLQFIPLITELFKSGADVVDSMHTSEEEKINAKGKILALQNRANQIFEEFSSSILKAQTSIIVAEANSQSWLARNWRPVTMLSFVVAILAFWFGLTPATLTEQNITDMFSLVKLGLGGYVVGRSGEKIAKSVAGVLKDK